MHVSYKMRFIRLTSSRLIIHCLFIVYDVFYRPWHGLLLLIHLVYQTKFPHGIEDQSSCQRVDWTENLSRRGLHLALQGKQLPQGAKTKKKREKKRKGKQTEQNKIKTTKDYSYVKKLSFVEYGTRSTIYLLGIQVTIDLRLFWAYS